METMTPRRRQMFDLNLSRADHVRRYSVFSSGGGGWEVRLEEDSTLKRSQLYHDWHRVERVLALFAREVSELTEHGWVVS